MFQAAALAPAESSRDGSGEFEPAIVERRWQQQLQTQAPEAPPNRELADRALVGSVTGGKTFTALKEFAAALRVSRWRRAPACIQCWWRGHLAHGCRGFGGTEFHFAFWENFEET